MNLEMLIKSNEKLIYKIASKFYGVEKDDLYQAGLLGMLKAYSNYNKDATCKFSTYAYDYIYGEMYQLAHNKTLKINKDILKLVNLIEKARYQLAQRINRIPSNKEISEFLNISEKNINDAIMAGKEIVSLDFEKDDMCLYDCIADNNSNDIDNKILINESLELLNPSEKEIIKARYYDDLSQMEVARKLKMTQVMVSRYEKKSLAKMQEFMRL